MFEKINAVELVCVTALGAGLIAAIVLGATEIALALGGALGGYIGGVATNNGGDKHD